MGAAAVVTCGYLGVLGLLSLNGLHRLWLVIVWLRRAAPPAPPPPAEWPRVTVQLPTFDERYVVERAIRAAAALDYPADRLEVQVLDDSTDDTTDRARAVVDALRAEGRDVVLLHRTDRAGFKAGALAAGLAVAKGELVCVFDADFVPPPDVLRRMVPWFTDPSVGMVQARWGHLNADADWLTRAQATLLDGHFVIEHTARHVSGRWFNFNGTAGIWRRSAIEAGGGWAHDTLTEDLDLSYRAQLAGQRFVYLPDVVVPAELPADVRAFKAQQHRWAKGSIQTLRKLIRRVWASDAPLPVKLEATTHLAANLSYPLVVVLSVLLPLAVAARLSAGAELGPLLAVDLVLFLGAILPFVLFYGLAIVGSGSGGVAGRWLRLPVVLSLGLGLALAQTRAVFEGFGASVGTFVRTPKSGGAAAPTYRSAGSLLALGELALAAWLGGAAVWAASAGGLASVPFLALFAAGYAAVGTASLRGERARA